MQEKRNACRVLIGKPKLNRLLGRPMHRWEGNVKMDLKDLQWKGVDWMYLAQNWDKWWILVNTVVNCDVPLSVKNFVTS